jgi:hypothetical protein
MMKKVSGILYAFLPLVIAFSLYLVFYSRIECKPSHPGFWFVLALGMSLGVALTRFSQWQKGKDNK